MIRSLIVVVALTAPVWADSSVPEPKRFELVKDVPVVIAPGVTARLKDVFEAHLSESRNEFRLTLTVTRDKKTQEVQMQELRPGPHHWFAALGLKLAIDYVDAYHTPSRGAILVLRYE